MANNNAPISEEIVAAITAAVEMMVGRVMLFVLNVAMHGLWLADAMLFNKSSIK